MKTITANQNPSKFIELEHATAVHTCNCALVWTVYFL